MRVLVTGASGQLGYDVCRELTRRGIVNRGVDIEELDITDGNAVGAFIDDYSPDALIHCAAWTAVEAAEDDPERARKVNTDGTRNIAAACERIGTGMMYISTDYVFPGTGELYYEPDDPTGPLNVYGRTKLDGERAVREQLSRYFIVRISWAFGRNGNNFVKTMLQLAKMRDKIRVVCDQIGSPTYTADVAPLLCDMIETEKYGTYHATNEGVCSWAELAREIFKIAGIPVKVEPVLSDEYSARAVRPLNSRLSKDKLVANGFPRLPDWHDAVERFLKTELEEQKV